MIVSATEAGIIVIGWAAALPPISTMVTGALTKPPGKTAAGTVGLITDGSLIVTAVGVFTVIRDTPRDMMYVPAAEIGYTFWRGAQTQPTDGPR